MSRSQFTHPHPRTLVFTVGLLALIAWPSWTGRARAVAPESRPLEVTSTVVGKSIAASTVRQFKLVGHSVSDQDLHVWELIPGEWLIGEALPENLHLQQVQGPQGPTVNVTYEVGRSLGSARSSSASVVAAASGPSWIWLDQFCFARLSSLYGWLMPCYVEHGMVNETDRRDFYQLEQYGTVAAQQTGGRIYNGWLAAVRASDSAPMSWIDWSPRGSLSGPARTWG